MKRSVLKICLFFVAFAMMASAFLSFATLAAKAVVDESDSGDGEYVVWTLTKDGTLSGNGKIYTYYETPIMPEILATKQFHYRHIIGSVEGFGQHNEAYTVSSYEKNGEIVWLGRDKIFVTEEGRAHLDGFFSGDSQEYLIYDEYGPYACELPASVKSELEACEGEKKTFNLTSLPRYTRYDVKACDTKGVIGYSIGTVFYIDNDFYYVDHEKLDNSYFDAEGNISFRKGSIELVKLDAQLTSKIGDHIDKMEYRSVRYEYEDGTAVSEDASNFEYVWHAFICPIGGIAAGLILPQCKKLGKPKRWYAVAALSAVILILSAILTVLYSGQTTAFYII